MARLSQYRTPNLPYMPQSKMQTYLVLIIGLLLAGFSHHIANKLSK